MQKQAKDGKDWPQKKPRGHCSCCPFPSRDRGFLMAELVANDQLERLQRAVSAIIEQDAVKLTNVEFRATSDAGVGIYTTCDVAAGTPLVTVPFASTISVERIVAHERLSKIIQENEGLMQYPDEILAIGLMFAKLHPADCSWGLHVSTMPTAFNTPIYWEDHEVEWLRGTNVFHLTGMLKRQIQGDYASIYIPLQNAYPEELGGISVHLYCWALSVVYSRALDITRRDQSVRVIVPLLDMANHHYSEKAEAEQTQDEAGDDSSLPSLVQSTDTFGYDAEQDSLSLLAAHGLSAGSECFAVYGRYCNAKLLYTYGFVLLDNPYQAIDLWTKLLPSSAHAAIKQRVLERHGLCTSQHTYDFVGSLRAPPLQISRKLVDMIRVLQADSLEELQRIDQALRAAGEERRGGLGGLRNERATYRALRELLVLRLGDVDKAEDERRELGEMCLADVSRSERRYLALVVRVGERECVREAIGLVDAWSEELEEKGDDFAPHDVPH